jgi:hypothetical protein
VNATWRLSAIGVAVVVVAAVAVLERYGGLAFWPALVTEFAATLVAVFLALEIERRRERAALERVAKDTDKIRSTEARKRLLALQDELERNQASIGEIVDGLANVEAGTWKILHPQLLDGAWTANGERLGDLLAKYDIVAGLATFYGRLEELRWRIRHRTQARDLELDGMILALAKEMVDEVADVLRRVKDEAQDPDVGFTKVTHLSRVSLALTLGKVEREPGSS